MFKAPLAAAIAACLAFSAAAEERRLITTAPTAAEYVDHLFEDQRAAPPLIKTRSAPPRIKTRGIQMTGAGAGATSVATATTTVAAATTVSTAAPSTRPAQPPVQQTSAPAPRPEPKPVLAAPVNFAHDSAVIPADFTEYLVNLAEAMKAPQAKGKVLIVSGHTDSHGADAYNLALSMRRAEAVKDFLVARGAPADFIVAVGRGETEPLPGRAGSDPLNRRVEFKVPR